MSPLICKFCQSAPLYPKCLKAIEDKDVNLIRLYCKMWGSLLWTICTIFTICKESFARWFSDVKNFLYVNGFR